MHQSPKASYPDPWDDLEDYIDRIFWLTAIENGEQKLLARYCRETVVVDRGVMSALADRLNPQGAGPYYEWKKSKWPPGWTS